jgi:thioredoxin 1
MEAKMDNAPLMDRLASHSRPVIVDVWAPWCAPCRRMAPIVERLAAEYDGRVDVWKINADEQPEDVRRLKVLGIPTMIIFRGGREVGRKVGAGSEGDLRALFEAALSDTVPARRGLPGADRLLRLAAGGALVVLGLTTGPSLILLAAGGLVLFSAIADRCPVWQAIRPRLAAFFGRGDTSSSGA